MKNRLISLVAAFVLAMSVTGIASAADVNAVQDARLAKLEATVSKLIQAASQSRAKAWASPMAVQVASFQVEGVGVDVLAAPMPLPAPDYAEVTPNNFSGVATFFNDGTWTMSLSTAGATLQMQADANGQPEFFTGMGGGPQADNGTYVLNGLALTMTSALDGSVTTMHLMPDFSVMTGSKTIQDNTLPLGTFGYSTQLIVATRIN